MHSIQRIADRVRELRLQQEEVRYPFWFELRRARLAISFERGTTVQQAHPIQIIRMLIDHKVGIKQNAEIACPLDIFAELDKVPALVVIHSGVRYSVKPIRSFANQAHHSHCTCVVVGLQLRASDGVKETIEVLPHLRADFLADLPGILASSADAFHNREGSLRIRHQEKQSAL